MRAGFTAQIVADSRALVQDDPGGWPLEGPAEQEDSTADEDEQGNHDLVHACRMYGRSTLGAVSVRRDVMCWT